ncbi:uncharacterized protein LOC116617327 [Nematostella vectensis]|uniref:uncharacterized protein LOC116617327 n=1 Tax=Nematostella vectensis TaxID=45351 RepID=UPI00207731D3|nr:uncharacterized protein LOC116617327 [Nematostella vectensis]
MRFEAKHNYFKKLSLKVNNFRNMTYSLVKRHQLLQSYLLHTIAGQFLKMHLEVGPGRKVTIEQEELFALLHEIDEEITKESTVVCTSWNKVYKKGNVLVLSL